MYQLTCPRDHSSLHSASESELRCERGHSYPVVDGIPVMLLDDVPHSMGIFQASIDRAKGEQTAIDRRNPGLYLESLGISEAEKEAALALASADPKIDPVVSVIVAATNGIAYKHLIGTLREYPIPQIRLRPGKGATLLDIGCNWGRWSIAAARKGYRVIGVDPSLGAIMAARRVATQLGLSIEYICADARYLPFAAESFDTVFSYSVIQHFSKQDARKTFAEISRVLKNGGASLVQMPNRLGLRSLYNLTRRRFAEGAGFEVRFWSIGELRRTFEECIGPSDISVHCYFGLGLEPSDAHVMSATLQAAIRMSEALRNVSLKVPALIRLADSVYVGSTKRN